MYPACADGRFEEWSEADKKEGEAVEEKGDGENVDRLEVTEDKPPKHRGDEIDCGHNVELLCRFTNFACEKGYLIRVCRYDLAKGEKKAVGWPVSDFDLEISEILLAKSKRVRLE